MIKGATSQKIHASQSGTYKLEVSANGCLISAEKEFVVAGEISPNEAGIHVYPNPVSGTLTIEVDGTVEAIGEIFSVTGTKLASVNFVSKNYLQISTQDFSNFSSGVYLIKISQSDKVKFVRVIKE